MFGKVADVMLWGVGSGGASDGLRNASISDSFLRSASASVVRFFVRLQLLILPEIRTPDF